MSFELLSTPIKKFVFDKGWQSLRAIQNAAIKSILTSSGNYILASRTASGKTEAAFLPVLSCVDFSELGVQVIYISPLIALINDQFIRIEELCKYLDVTITKWHGEAKKSLKDNLIKNPSGIILITPESLEAMFVNKSYLIKALFPNLKFIVIDEVHSFIGRERGVQLQSIIARLKQSNKVSPRVIGLSATIGDYDLAKKLAGDINNTKILQDKSKKEINVLFKYYQASGYNLPIELLDDLYNEIKEKKVLIFPNSRAKVEEVAVQLKKRSDINKGHGNYFSHHSAIDKEFREYIEHFAKNNTRINFCISCTSTLELGIDIGTLDEVIQIDSTNSISSLIQRIGRCGRRENEISQLTLFSTSDASLLQSIACWELYKSGFIEPPENLGIPYDILLHQLLSTIKQLNGCTRIDIVKLLLDNYAFQNVTASEIEEIISVLIKADILELIGNELIIGIEGERIVNSKDFYSVFITENNLKVINKDRIIGELQDSDQIVVGENIYLSARIWKIIEVDLKARKVYVNPANDGKSPIFSGGSGNVHSRIMEKMLEILCEDVVYDELNQTCYDVLNNLRNEFSYFQILDSSRDRPVIAKEDKIIVFPFTGSKITGTIAFLLKYLKLDFKLKGFSIEINTDMKFETIISELLLSFNSIDANLEEEIVSNPYSMSFSKWGRYLPLKCQIYLLKHRLYDFQGAHTFLNDTRFVFAETNPER